MSHPRLLAPDGFSHAIYHCVSRVVNREKVLGPGEKEVFTKYMRLYAELYGVRVLTHCVMDNHFHILVDVPRRPEVLPTNAELVATVRATLGDGRADNLANWFSLWEKSKNWSAIDQERERWFKQMWNLASYMKVLKQRFSQWFNGTRTTRRIGTLWESRYRSVLVEKGDALRAIAAYIDLNPVRAGLVSDPKDYRWSGYAEAVAGRAEAQDGLLWIAKHPSPENAAPAAASTSSESAAPGTELDWYREWLYAKGEEVRDEQGVVVRRGFSEEEIENVRKTGGRLPIATFLRLRVRYFTDGAVLGTTAFVESVFQAHRKRFSERRRTGSRRLARLDLDNPLRVARALAVRAVG
jgi:REP element-mobilizing transposase RayT